MNTDNFFVVSNGLVVNGPVTASYIETTSVTASFLGNLTGTSSWASNAITASYIDAGNITTGTLSNNRLPSAINITSVTASILGNLTGNITGSASNALATQGTLSQGSNITSFSFNGSSNATVALSAAISLTSVTASILGNTTGTTLTASYVDAGNITTGTLVNARLPAQISVTGVTASFLGNLTGSATNAFTSSYLLSATNAYLQSGNSFGATGVLGLNDNNRLDIKSNNAVVMTLSSSNVGIGTTNPSLAILQVNGNVYATNYTGSLNADNIVVGTLSNSRLPSAINVTSVTASFLGNITGNLTGSSANSLLLSGNNAAYYINADNINAGTLSNSRLPSQISVTGITASFLGNITGSASNALKTQGTLSQGTNITDFTFDGSANATVGLPAAINLTSITASFLGNLTGTTLTASYIDAGNITTGTLSNSRLPSQISVTGISGSFTGSFAGGMTFTGKTNNYVPIWRSNELSATSSLFDTGNNVGIGTIVPDAKLEVSALAGSSSIRLSETNLLSGSGALHSLEFSRHTYGVTAAIKTISADSKATNLIFYTTTGGGGSVLTQQMVIQNDGNVGIGTTDPSLAILQVNGNVHATSYTGSVNADNIVVGTLLNARLPSSINVTSVTASVLGNLTGNITGSASNALSTQGTLSQGTNITAFSFDGSTNATVGLSADINLTSVTASVLGNVTGNLTGSATHAFSSSYSVPTSNAYIQGGNSFETVGTLGLNDNNRLDIKANNAVVMTLSGSNVGIGTTNPTLGKLQVQGNIYATNYTGSVNADNIVVGTLSNSRLPSAINLTSVTASILGNVTGTTSTASYIDAGNITTGTLLNARLPAQISVTGVTASFLGNITGSSANSLLLSGQNQAYYTNATNINAGTIGNSYLPTQISVTGVTASVLGNITGSASNALKTQGTLSQGSNITVFSFDGSTNATVGLPASITLTAVTAAFSGNVTGNVTGNLTGSATNAFTSSYLLSATNAYLQSGNSFGATGVLGLNDNNRLDIKSNNAVVMTLSSSNVGIGTTNPGSLLDVFKQTTVNPEVREVARFRSYRTTFGDHALSAGYIGFWGGDTGGGLNLELARLQWGSPNTSLNYNYLSFYVYNGSTLGEKMRITPSGKVGIGVTNPTTNLNVYGDGGSAWQLHLKDSGANGTRFDIGANNTECGLVANYGSAAVPMTFTVAAAEKMRISSTGNVGIGTTTPTLAKLQINGNVYATSYTGSLFTNKTNNYVPIWRSNELSATSSIFDTGNNVGIGTNNPAVKFELYKNQDGSLLQNITNQATGTNTIVGIQLNAGITGSTGVLYQFAASYASIYEYVAGATVLESQGPGGLILSDLGGTGIHFYPDASTEKISILASGYVGIGTVTPQNELHVVGTTRIQGSNVGYFSLSAGSTTTSASYNFPTANGSNNTVLTNDGNGNLTWSTKTGGVTGSIVSINGSVEAAQTIAGDSGLISVSDSGVGNPTHTVSANLSYAPTWTGKHTFNAAPISAIFSGSVGIGITNPSYKLEVVDGRPGGNALHVRAKGASVFSPIAIFSDSTTNYADLEFYADTTTFYINTVTDNDNIAFQSLSETKMFISGSGNVGIGTVTPTLGKLQVNGNVYATSYTGSLNADNISTGTLSNNRLPSDINVTSVTASILGNVTGNVTGSSQNALKTQGTLSQGTNITAFTFDGSANATVGLPTDISLTSVTASFKGNLTGTSSWASNAISSSYSLNSTSASYIDAGNITTGTLSNSRLPSAINITSITASVLGNVTGNLTGSASNALKTQGTLSQGTNITNFTFDGSGNATVGLPASISLTSVTAAFSGDLTGNASSATTATTAGSTTGTLSQGTNITAFSYNGSGNATVGLPAAISVTSVTGAFNGNLTGSSANSLLLSGQNQAYYTNATNINAGTLSNSRLPTSINVLSFTGSLIATDVAPGTYGDATNVAQVTVGADGRLNAAQNISITFPATAAYATNAGTLGGQAGSYYTNASNINAGTINNSYLPAAISVTSVTASVLGNLTGTATTASYTSTNTNGQVVGSGANYTLTEGDFVTVTFGSGSPTHTLNAGTYFLICNTKYSSGESTSTSCDIRLYNSTDAVALAGAETIITNVSSTTNPGFPLTVSCIATLSGTKTIVLQARDFVLTTDGSLISVYTNFQYIKLG